MASRRLPSDPQRPSHSIEQKLDDVRRLKWRMDELAAFDPATLQVRDDPRVLALQTSIDEALSGAFGHGTVEYRRYREATALDRGPRVMRFDPFGENGGGGADEAREARQYVAEGRERSLALLGQAVRAIEEEIEDETSNSGSSKAAKTDDTSVEGMAAPNRKVFVVHGHDEASREAVARFLAQLGFEPIILHEQASQGRTVIEKVEAHGNVGFAVVLLTPDDVGGRPGGDLHPRARQNVVLELGYFLGSLGRKRVCALKRGDVEIPSDFGGVVYVTFDDGGGWKQALGRELEGAGHEVDWNTVMRAR